jgi:hypothetical protein
MMSYPFGRRIRLVAAIACVSLTVIGCGEKDTTKKSTVATTSTIAVVSQAEAQSGVTAFVEKISLRNVASVNCPKGVPAGASRTFKCEATLKFDKDLDLTSEQLDSSPDSWPTVGPTGTIVVTQTANPNAFRYEVVGAGTKTVNCYFSGLTREGTKTGKCTDVNGQIRIFANADDTLRMPQYTVKLVGVSTKTSINPGYETYDAAGTFAVIELRVTNTTNSTLKFEPTSLSTLLIGKNGQSATRYDPADVTDFVEPSFLGPDTSAEIGAGLPITAPIIFDIAPKLEASLRKKGSAISFEDNPEDTGSSGPTTIGYIRLKK